MTGPATAGTTDFVFIEAEDFLANTAIGGSTRAWSRIAPLNFNGVAAMQVPDNGFSQLTAANALTQSSRLDYQLNLAAATNYRVWLRMRSPAPSTANIMGTTTALGIAVPERSDGPPRQLGRQTAAPAASARRREEACAEAARPRRAPGSRAGSWGHDRRASDPAAPASCGTG